MTVCFFILLQFGVGGLGFFIGFYAFFTEFRRLFACVSPVVQVDFLDDHVGEVGIFIQRLYDQVGHSLDEGGFLFAGGAFAGDLNFYVWHGRFFLSGFRAQVNSQYKIVVDEGIAQILEEVAAAKFHLVLGAVDDQCR